MGDDLRPEATEYNRAEFDAPERGSQLYEYLYHIIDTQAEDIAPTPENLVRYFGQDGGFFKTATALLTVAHREQPTVAVTRKLWRELLQVAIGQNFKFHRKTAKPLAPGKVTMWSGPTGTSQVRRSLTDLPYDDGRFRSPYAYYANQGPTIVDRRLFFVTASSNENRFAPLDTFETYPRTGTLDKKEYSVAELEGQIVGGDNLFSVYLGESLAPYGTLPPLTAALPASKATMAVPLDHSDCLGWPDADVVIHSACRFDRQGLDPNMRVRWEKMERLWEANRSKADKKSLWQNLNWINKLTSQLDYLRDPGDLPVRIAYTTSGRPTAALIANKKAILDTTLYQVSCRNLDEAYYLLAIINSNALEGEVSDFRPKGLFGDRDLHKHLWKLPIPEYDANSEDHVKLSGLGRTAEQEATERFKGMEASLSPEKLTYNRVRAELRDVWQPTSKTAAAIELAVGKLLVTG